jgi:hypothetical protein
MGIGGQNYGLYTANKKSYHPGLSDNFFCILYIVLIILIFYCLYTSNTLVNSVAPGGNALHKLGLYSMSNAAPLKISFLLSD